MALLSQRSPFRALRELEDRLEDVFATRLSEGNGESGVSLSRWAPAVDIYEENDTIHIDCELAGIDREDVDIEVDDNRLVIRGARREEKEVGGEDRDYYRSERIFDSFERSFSLPNTVDREQIEARMENGVLKLSLPKTERSKSQQIEIQ